MIFVLVPIHDREELIQPCLDALKDAGEPYELCIVANGCAFDPAPYLAQADYPVLVPQGLGPAAARNQGLGHRKPGQDLLSLDSDIVFQGTHGLRTLRRTLYAEGWGAISPAIDNGAGPVFHGTRPGDGIKTSLVLPVGARLIRGPVVDALGYFRVYPQYGCEDLDYDARMGAAGWTIGYNANVSVSHPGIPSDDRWKRDKLEENLPKLKSWQALYERGLMIHKPSPEMDFIPEMNPRWLSGVEKLAEYGSHLQGLRWAVDNTSGPVLEMGVGYHSTPYLNQVSRGMRQVVSVEKNPRWTTLAKERVESPAHWVVSEIPPGLWSVVLIDGETEERKPALLSLRPYTEVFVIHDTEDLEEYGWSEDLFDSFTYRADYGVVPRTTVLSDSVDVRALTDRLHGA